MSANDCDTTRKPMTYINAASTECPRWTFSERPAGLEVIHQALGFGESGAVIPLDAIRAYLRRLDEKERAG
ncbi:MAG: hypothetical protein ACE5FA_01110 [Dehalococcoidia bacterium]